MKLIIPVAGSSSRYPGIRPKWMLTLPSGELLIENCIKGFDLKNIEQIVLIAQKNHLEDFDMSKSYLINTFEEKFQKQTNLFLLDSPTISQPMTIFKYLSSLKEDISFYIKDCDNYFEDRPIKGNTVSYLKLDDLDLVAASNKSYIKINSFSEIEQIQEKEVISENFCVGGYSFNSSKQYIKEYFALDGDNNANLYVSHIIQRLILCGERFSATAIKEYIDYGTSKEYFLETRKTVSLFCDFDGVIVKNSSKFSNNPWSYKPLSKNIDAIKNKLDQSKDSILIITTSRPSTERENISKFCKKVNLKVKQIITDLPHCKRFLINDFSSSNPYPSSIAINLKRNEENIKDYLFD